MVLSPLAGQLEVDRSQCCPQRPWFDQRCVFGALGIGSTAPASRDPPWTRRPAVGTCRKHPALPRRSARPPSQAPRSCGRRATKRPRAGPICYGRVSSGEPAGWLYRLSQHATLSRWKLELSKLVFSDLKAERCDVAGPREEFPYN